MQIHLSKNKKNGYTVKNQSLKHAALSDTFEF